MFKAWKTFEYRPTMDIDLLGRTSNNINSLENIFKALCLQKTPVEDGIVFLSESVRGSPIQSDVEYEGVRVELNGGLHQALIPIQIDIGFGDLIIPGPESILYPTILDFPPPKLQGYTSDSLIAEKLETMMKRGYLFRS